MENYRRGDACVAPTTTVYCLDERFFQLGSRPRYFGNNLKERFILLVIPAVDLLGGQAVRLRQGKKTEQTTYFADPVEPARLFAGAGATLLHVVDLDGAFEGESRNSPSVRRIVEAAGPTVKVELGGGIRSLEAIERSLALGVIRVILGTAALTDPGLLTEALKRFGSEKIVAGVDAVDGKVAIRGWEQQTATPALELAGQLARLGLQRIIYTDISTDGMLGGPNLEALKKICSVELKVIASGGIAEMEHVREMARLEGLGVEGMIIGKALYEGRIDLRAAIEAAAEKQK